VLDFLARRRRKQFETMLPDTLQLLASTLRAGYSLMQGVEAVSQEVSEPMGRELRRVVTEARLGRPLEESLDAVAERMGSNDFAWAVMAIRIQREVGGNLSELLVTVGDTMTERERLRRDVNALTAEGRVSAIVLGILPIGVGAFIAMGNPGYLDPLFDRDHRAVPARRCHRADAGGVLLDEEDHRDRDLMRTTRSMGDWSPDADGRDRRRRRALGLVLFAVLSQAEEKATIRASLRQLDDYEVESVRDKELLVPLRERALAPDPHRPHRDGEAVHAGRLRRAGRARSSSPPAPVTRRRSTASWPSGWSRWSLHRS
jgi:hypothetical protein